MKVVLLAGGYGTRLSEETEYKPKPLIEIGGKPILWHIMKRYAMAGFNEFIICLGYKGHKIKEYFHNYYLYHSQVTFDLSSGDMQVHDSFSENWKVTLIDTGLDTYTGGRIKRIHPYCNNETFMLTYCDGLSDVKIDKLFSFHQKHGKKVTLTAVQPANRFGVIDYDKEGLVLSFREKPHYENGWINGGYFVCEPSIFSYIQGDKTIWERDPLENLVKEQQVMVFPHTGYWQCMDTVHDKQLLEKEWDSGNAPWQR